MASLVDTRTWYADPLRAAKEGAAVRISGGKGLKFNTTALAFLQGTPHAQRAACDPKLSSHVCGCAYFCGRLLQGLEPLKLPDVDQVYLALSQSARDLFGSGLGEAGASSDCFCS